jgi:hypothetical protein
MPDDVERLLQTVTPDRNVDPLDLPSKMPTCIERAAHCRARAAIVRDPTIRDEYLRLSIAFLALAQLEEALTRARLLLNAAPAGRVYYDA